MTPQKWQKFRPIPSPARSQQKAIHRLEKAGRTLPMTPRIDFTYRRNFSIDYTSKIRL